MRAILLLALVACATETPAPRTPPRTQSKCGYRPFNPEYYEHELFDQNTQRMCLLDSDYAALDVWVLEVNTWIDCKEMEGVGHL